MTTPVPPKERQLNTFLRRSLLLPVVSLIGVMLLLSWAAGRVLSQAELVRHTDEIMTRANLCLKLAVDMETGVRGYQLTGDEALLQPYSEARAAIEEEFGRLQRLVLDAAQAQQLQRVRGKLNAWEEFGEEIIRLRASGGDISAAALHRRGKALFDAVRAEFAEFVRGEERLKAERVEQFTATNRRLLSARTVMLVGLGVGLGLFTRRQLRAVAEMFRASEANALREAENARRSADELRKAHDELERRVEERTRELKVALEKAQEVDRLKSEFLATMSHELRTPLNSIIGFTEIVLAGIPGDLNEEQTTQLRFVHNSANHLLHLINDLLDLARIESGRVEPAWEEFAPRDVIDEALSTIRPLAERKQLRLVAELALPDSVQLDRKMFFQVLLNLLGNAVKFTERGEVRLTTKVQDQTLVTTVRDSGIGIKPEQRAMLFEAFRQVDGSVHRRYEGTGLGLYLCKRIVGLLGGTIAAESEFGRGSTFTFTLPLRKA